MAELNYLYEDWPSISARLDEALALEPGERGRWIDALADADSVKDKLRSLLAGDANVETSDLLSTLPKLTLQPGMAGADGAHAAREGAAVGPYRLLAQLGHGGMGTVWLAERSDGQPRRKVALKLPHLGWAPGLTARLARERDILASLEHPNIARLYDAGVDQLGRPYLALEYVDGVPIDRYCEAHGLGLRARLGLVLQIAAAVAYAHTRLIVHRDLKPSNILVTESGAVRLLDFGIAKLLVNEGSGAATELTGHSGLPMTPAYASPEQVQGLAIGTASDVYSLGVVTYELATGVRPHAAKELTALGRGDPPLASRNAVGAAKRQLAGDIDAILNKALKTDPAERYPTVVAFADDLERHLRHAPVAAQPDRLAYRARKFIVRNGLSVGAGAVVLTAVLAGSGVALWQARQARFEAARAEQVKDFALSIFEKADTDSGAGAATTAADLLMAAQARVENEFAGRPEVAVELMTAVGYSLIGQGRLGAAAELLRKASERGARELGARHPLALAAAVVYGEALIDLKRPAEAITVLTPAVAEARRQDAVHTLVTGLMALSAAQIDSGDADAGVASARDAVSIVTSHPVGKLDAITAWSSLAHALQVTQQEGQVDAARRALALAEDLQGPKVSEPVLFARLVVAQGRIQESHDSAALADLDAILNDSVQFLGPFHPRVEVTANMIGRTRLDAGDPEGAAAAFRIQLSAAEKTASDRELSLQMAHYAVGVALAAAHRWPDALDELETSSALATSPGADAALALRARSYHALVLARMGRLDAAERDFASLADVAWPDADKAAHASRLAVLRSLQGRHDEAIALARLAWAGVSSNPSRSLRAHVAKTLGMVLLAAGQAGEAAAPLRDAVRLYAEQQLLISPDRADALAALARATAGNPPASTSAPR